MYLCLWFLLSAAAAPPSAVKTDLMKLMKLVRLVSFSIIALTERNPGLTDTKKNEKGNFKSKQETNFLTQQILAK